MNPYINKPKSDKVYIYTLSNSETNEVRYVGKTTQSLNCRLATHNCSKKKSHTVSWIKSLKRKGIKIRIELLDIVNSYNWEENEQFYITYLKYLGFNLTNHSIGGDKSNLGATWKWSIEQKNNKIQTLNNRDKQLRVLNIYSGKIQNFKNYKEISNYYKITYSKVVASSRIKTLINKTFIVLKDKENYNINTKIGVKRVQATNIISNEVLIANNKKELAIILQKDNSLIGKALKQNFLIENKYKIEYVLS